MPVAPGHHGLDEALVAGDVDHAEMAAAGEGQLGEAQLDADAALLLLLEPVGVAAGEGLDQGGLAVIDVTGGAESEGTERTGHDLLGPRARAGGGGCAVAGLVGRPGRTTWSIAQATLSATASRSRSSRASTSRCRLSCETRAMTGTGARRRALSSAATVGSSPPDIAGSPPEPPGPPAAPAGRAVPPGPPPSTGGSGKRMRTACDGTSVRGIDPPPARALDCSTSRTNPRRRAPLDCRQERRGQRLGLREAAGKRPKHRDVAARPLGVLIDA